MSGEGLRSPQVRGQVLSYLLHYHSIALLEEVLEKVDIASILRVVQDQYLGMVVIICSRSKYDVIRIYLNKCSSPRVGFFI